MATVTSWSGNFAEMGPIYPWVGAEGILLIIALIAWIAWHVLQTKMENQTYAEEEKEFGDAESLRSMVGKDDAENP